MADRRARTLVIISFAVFAAAVTAVGAVVLPVVFDNTVTIEQTEEIDLTPYMPFGYGTGEYYTESLAASLNEPSSLKFVADFELLPRLDGATALYPLYAAFARATYPEVKPDDAEDYSHYIYNYYVNLGGDMETIAKSRHDTLVISSRSYNAFCGLLNGTVDIAFLMGLPEEFDEYYSYDGLTLTPIGREAFVFFVNKRNPIDDISSADIKRVYSGEVTNWKQVGGGNDKIRAYQRPENSGSQTMLEQIMVGTPIMPAPEDEIFTTMLGMVRYVADYRNYRNAVGYSFLYYAKDMVGENDIKFLSIDGVAPTAENIANGTYPFANDFYAVTLKHYLNPERADNIDAFLEWITGPQGRYLVEATGYAPCAK